MVDFHALQGLQVALLTFEFVGEFPLGSACVDDGLLVFAELEFAGFFEFGVFAEESLDLFFEFIVVDDPLVLFPFFLVQISIELPLSVFPVLLLISEFAFDLFSEGSFLLSFSFTFLAFVLPLDF